MNIKSFTHKVKSFVLVLLVFTLTFTALLSQPSTVKADEISYRTTSFRWLAGGTIHSLCFTYTYNTLSRIITVTGLTDNTNLMKPVCYKTFSAFMDRFLSDGASGTFISYVGGSSNLGTALAPFTTGTAEVVTRHQLGIYGGTSKEGMTHILQRHGSDKWQSDFIKRPDLQYVVPKKPEKPGTKFDKNLDFDDLFMLMFVVADAANRLGLFLLSTERAKFVANVCVRFPTIAYRKTKGLIGQLIPITYTMVVTNAISSKMITFYPQRDTTGL